MRELYPRLFEAPVLANGLPDPRHLPLPVYLAFARRAAVRGARRNGVKVSVADVSFPGGGFAPTRVAVRVRGEARVKPLLTSAGPAWRFRCGRGRPRRCLRIWAPRWGCPAFGSGGGYDGPLAYRMGKPMRPDVALAFDRMAAAARAEAGLLLSIFQRLSLRRPAGQAVCRKPQPEVGRSAGHQPPPLRHRARPRPAGRLRLATGELSPLRLHPALQMGALALRGSISGIPMCSPGRGAASGLSLLLFVVAVAESRWVACGR